MKSFGAFFWPPWSRRFVDGLYDWYKLLGGVPLTHEELLLFGERIRDRRNSIGMTQKSVAEQVNKRKYCSYTQPPVGIANETMLPDWKSMVLFFSIRDSISISIEIKIYNPITNLYPSVKMKGKRGN